MHRLRRSFAVCLLALHAPFIAAAQTPPTETQRDAPPVTPGSAAPDAAPMDQTPPATPPPAERAPPEAAAAPSAATPNPEQRIQDLERRLREVEQTQGARHLPVPETKSTDKPAAGAAVAHGPDGIAIRSGDGKFQFRLRPLVQADARFFIDGGTNTLLVRRVRPSLEGTLFEYFDWRFMPELTRTPTILDAFVNLRLFREIQLRAGKFKPPVGLERLMSAADLPFVERGLPQNLVPRRDIGVQVHGDFLGGTLVYAAGYFNGAGDGVNGNNDDNDKKDLVGRIFIQPFQPTFLPAVRKLGVGIAATRGTHVGGFLPYRTSVATPFFRYAEGVAAGGTHRRLAPQAHYYVGPFGAFAEYTRSTQIVVAPGTSAHLTHQSWQVVASFFVTGEEALPGPVTPKRQLDPRRLGFGALELVARFGELSIDRGAFRSRVADPTVSARKATNWGAGVNWHLARNVKWMLDYDHTSFDGGAPLGDRASEMLILTRLQAAY
jgi:phosphate-selective porin OprO and OprP